RACEHRGPKWPVRGLSANQLACALISMMARSTTRSNQRPDTLMQDRICQVDETSCNARPDHTLGQTEKNSPRANVFRVTPESGHRSMQSACLKGARFGPMHRSKQLKLFDHFVGAGEQNMRDCDLA